MNRQSVVALRVKREPGGGGGVFFSPAEIEMCVTQKHILISDFGIILYLEAFAFQI